MTRPTILLNPGPVTLTDRVRRALTREDLCHREPEFAELTLEIRSRLLGVHPGARGGFDAILLTGSGTCAVESMLATLLSADEKALVVTNGVYGERMAAMVRAHGKPLEVIASDWLDPIDLEGVDRALADDPSIGHVVAVHNETTTGRLDDIPSLGTLCKARGRKLLLDAVSSFGAEEIDFEGWNLEALAATANKCLHGAPGVSFVLLDPRALEGAVGRAPSLYLDLTRYHENQSSGFSPFTQAVHVCFALREALAELEEAGGWSARRDRYRELSERIRAALQGLGVECLIPPSQSSAMIRSYRLPPGRIYGELHDAIREHGFVLYAGQGRLADEVFRVATMGDIRDEDVERLIAALGGVLGP